MENTNARTRLTENMGQKERIRDLKKLPSWSVLGPGIRRSTLDSHTIFKSVKDCALIKKQLKINTMASSSDQ